MVINSKKFPLFLFRNIYQMISPLKQSLFRFSSSANITAKTFAKFQEKYAANVEAFKSKSSQASRYTDSFKKSTQVPYTHPFDNFNQDLIIPPLAAVQAQLDFLGGEPVSAHYENFGMARKEAIIFWAGYITLSFIGDTPDFHFFAQSASLFWLFGFSYMYFFTEGKKSLAMPFLNRFYRKIAMMEMSNLQTYYQENVEVKIRSLMAVAKSQIDYKIVHNEYVSIRNNALLSFMINEQIALKNHLYERATNILKQAEAIEANNQNKIINEVMSETLSSIDKAYIENKEEIEAAMFQLALKGIANGRMDYANDPILPHVVKTIQGTVDKFSKISPEDQRKMIVCNQDQLESIRASDVRLRDEYLTSEPKIDGSLRNNEIVGKILSRWGK